jgi:hypothetical protein
VIASIAAGMPVMVFIPVAIVPLHSSVIALLVPLRIAVPVAAGVLSTISAASSQRHQHCQK